MLERHSPFLKVYMDTLIGIMIPDGYLDTTVMLDDAVAKIFKMNKATE